MPNMRRTFVDQVSTSTCRLLTGLVAQAPQSYLLRPNFPSFIFFETPPFSHSKMTDINRRVDSFDENCWSDLIDYSSLLDDGTPPADLDWNLLPVVESTGVANHASASLSGIISQVNECAEAQEHVRKRLCVTKCDQTGSKACRERMRREKLNDRFSELSAILEPERPAKSDKFAILGDAIRVLNQLRTESQQFKEMNEKLSEEIKTLKDAKNELREEKLLLKTDKERLEQQLKSMAFPPPGFIPPHPAIYHQASPHKMPIFPSYSIVPIMQFVPPSSHDTSQEHDVFTPRAA